MVAAAAAAAEVVVELIMEGEATAREATELKERRGVALPHQVRPTYVLLGPY